MNIKNTKKIMFRFNVKIFISHVFGILVLIALTNIAISYSRNEFELPFYDRTKNSSAQIDYDVEAKNTDDITEEPEQPTEDITNAREVIKAEDLIERETEEADVQYGEDVEPTEPVVAFELFSDDMLKQGYSVTDAVYEIYDEAKTTGAVNSYKTEVNKIMNEYNANKNGGENADGTETENQELPVLPPQPVLYEYKFVRIEPEFEIPDSRTTASYDSKPVVETCMDYLILRDGESEVLCTASGNIISRTFDALELEILKMRDKEGRTVFKRNDGVYFVYDPADKKLHSIESFSEFVTGDRGVPFMYPSYYGKDGASNLDIDYYSFNQKWGYAVAGTGSIWIPRYYERTYNFSENIGIAYQEKPGTGKQLFFLDVNGNNYLSMDYGYFGPDAPTKDHLGFFYFDHGLTRVYEREYDRRNDSIKERELLVNYYGKPFYIPEDYNIKAYSNGMILLEKNGYYGFMNYLGEWIAHPIYKYAQPFYEGVAVIGLDNGKKTLIDTQGNFFTKFKYDAITNCTGGIVALYEKNAGWTILNKVRRQIPVD